MPIKMYADHHVDFAIVKGLRFRNIDILTAFEDKSNRLDDADLLDPVSELKRFFLLKIKIFLKPKDGRYLKNISAG